MTGGFGAAYREELGVPASRVRLIVAAALLVSRMPVAAQVTTPALVNATAPTDATAATPAVAIPGAPPPAPVVTCCTIPALTPVRLEFLAGVNSKLARIGEHFPFRLADPIALDDGSQVPAGTTGSGDVVHAAKSGFGGKPGELILAVRFLDHAGTRIPLRSLTYGAGRGRDQSGAAFAAAIAGGLAGSVSAMFITGGEVDIPAGTFVYAKTAAPVTLPRPAITPVTPTAQQESQTQ